MGNDGWSGVRSFDNRRRHFAAQAGANSNGDSGGRFAHGDGSTDGRHADGYRGFGRCHDYSHGTSPHPDRGSAVLTYGYTDTSNRNSDSSDSYFYARQGRFDSYPNSGKGKLRPQLS